MDVYYMNNKHPQNMQTNDPYAVKQSIPKFHNQRILSISWPLGVHWQTLTVFDEQVPALTLARYQKWQWTKYVVIECDTDLQSNYNIYLYRPLAIVTCNREVDYAKIKGLI